VSDIIRKQFGDNLEFKHPVCKDCKGNTFTVEISENDDILLHCVKCLNIIDFQIINRKQCCELEAEVARYKSNIDTTESATGMCGIYAELEAEVAKEKLECDKANKRSGERWKLLDAEIQNHEITKKELSELRACHAALVEAAKKVVGAWDDKSRLPKYSGKEIDDLYALAG